MRFRTGLLALALAAGPLRAQLPQSEVRADLIGPEPYAVHGGLGLTWALGNYARLGLVGAYGARPMDGRSRGEGRVDLIARMTLDPFRQHPVGFSIGGGLTVRERPHLVAIVDLEGPAVGWVVPALQLGVGFGYRAGLAFRRAIPNRR